MSISRRQFLATASLSTCSALGIPAIHAQDRSLRLLVTDDSPLPALKAQAEADLGIQLNIQVASYAQQLASATESPGTAELFEFRTNNSAILWQRRAIQPLSTARLPNWQHLNLAACRAEAQGTPRFGQVPAATLYVQPDGNAGAADTGVTLYAPFYFGFDSFFRTHEALPATLDESRPSWAWLLHADLRSRVALANSPASSFYDLCLAERAVMDGCIADPTRPTREELDTFFRHITGLTERRHFSMIWRRLPELIRSVVEGETLIANAPAQDIAALRSVRQSMRKIRPQEGFRARLNSLYLSSAASSYQQDLALELINWLLDVQAALSISRSGYTCCTPDLARSVMTAAEWDYWYGGQPARETVFCAHGTPLAEKGEMLAEGDYHQRFAHVALWSSAEIPHTGVILRHWGQLLRRG